MVNSAPEATSVLREDWPALSAAERAARFRDLSGAEAEQLFRELGATDQAGLLTHLPQAERRVFWRARPGRRGRLPAGGAGIAP